MLKWESTNFNDFATYVAQYKHLQQQFNRDESSEDINMTKSIVQEIALELNDEISDEVSKIIQGQGHLEYYESKLEPYISNENLRTQVARTLLKYPELKKLDQQTIDINIAHIISRMFQIPIEENLPQLNSTEIDPLLTYLTRVILFETLLDQNKLDNHDVIDEIDCNPEDNQDVYGKPIKYNYCESEYVTNEEVRWSGNPIKNDFGKEEISEYRKEETLRYPDSYDEVFIDTEDEAEESNNSIQEVKFQAIANLGNLGFEFIQEKLRTCAEEVYERKNTQQRTELANYLSMIHKYQTRISLNLLDETLLKRILENENQYLKEHSYPCRNEQCPILNLTMNILHNFSLNSSSEGRTISLSNAAKEMASIKGQIQFLLTTENDSPQIKLLKLKVMNNLTNRGSAIEPYLLKIIQEAKANPNDSEQQEQAKIAESILNQASYLPELTSKN